MTLMRLWCPRSQDCGNLGTVDRVPDVPTVPTGIYQPVMNIICNKIEKSFVIIFNFIVSIKIVSLIGR